MSDLYTAKELKERISNNDNRCTASPYLLLLRRKVKVSSCSDSDNFEYVENLSGDYQSSHSKEELKKDLLESGYSSFEINKFGSITKWHYQYVFDTENVFLTDEGYKDHLNINAHNLGEHDTYGIHAFRNKEISSLLNLIDVCIENDKQIKNLQDENKKLREALGNLLHHCERYNRAEESMVLAMEIETAYVALEELK